MDGSTDEVLGVLREIRDTLNRIYICFEDEYIEIQRQRFGEKVKTLESLLKTESRKKIFPLLFDKTYLSQTDIAEAAGVTQSD